jgi:Family of unknown function (DUF6498)
MSEHDLREAAPAGAPLPRSQPMPAIVIAQVVVRNVVPVVGILLFGWRAFNVLALYFVDTMMIVVVLCAVIARALTPPDKSAVGGGVGGELRFVAAGFFIAAFMAIPLGIPLLFMANGDMGTIGMTLSDRGFYVGAAIQAAMALWTCVALRRGLAAGMTLETMRVKRRFAMVFLRWVAVLLVAYTGIGLAFGRYAPFLFVVVYVVASIVAEIAPDRFLRAMPGGFADAEPSRDRTRRHE